MIAEQSSALIRSFKGFDGLPNEVDYDCRARQPMSIGMERINIAVREHEIAVKWDYQEVAQRIYLWFDIFNAEFFEGALPTPFLQFECTRQSTLGHYRQGRNGVGAQHEINLNRLHLDAPFFEVLGTLLHEIAHQWQELFGKPGKGGYHNQEFTRKCASLGIPCTGGYRSISVGYGPPFVSLLRQHGVDAEVGVYMPSPAKPTHPTRLLGSSKLKKWSCGCTNVRVAVALNAQCLECGGIFIQKD